MYTKGSRKRIASFDRTFAVDAGKAPVRFHQITDQNAPIPACTYTIPCFARVGLSLKEARAAGYSPALGTFDYSANGMALAEGAGGCVFVVSDKATTKTLGVTVVGADAAELIALAAKAVADGTTLEQWENLVVAHPSLTESLREAALDCFRKSVHKG